MPPSFAWPGVSFPMMGFPFFMNPAAFNQNMMNSFQANWNQMGDAFINMNRMFNPPGSTFSVAGKLGGRQRGEVANGEDKTDD